jgi:hypothetical protein
MGARVRIMKKKSGFIKTSKKEKGKKSLIIDIRRWLVLWRRECRNGRMTSEKLKTNIDKANVLRRLR